MKDRKAPIRGRRESQWSPFNALNYRLFFGGILLIIIGYIMMMQGPHDSFLSLHLSPVLLVLGYCVIIPLAILLKPKVKDSK
ncbi:hypothetical protein KJ564_10540 [bacterium]|nr:hypothetical protein [bacterium]MBU1881975.1 hypothetical protein [bacterium]